jgi:Amt family ammonium transporter
MNTTLNTTLPSPAVFNGGDVGFLFCSTVLVFIMIPGVGFFYSGLVRQKNAAATIFQSFATCIVAAIRTFQQIKS